LAPSLLALAETLVELSRIDSPDLRRARSSTARSGLSLADDRVQLRPQVVGEIADAAVPDSRKCLPHRLSRQHQAGTSSREACGGRHDQAPRASSDVFA
jgi:hypothetical protein